MEEVLIKAKGFERDGANAVYLMATAQYPFEKFLEIGGEVSKQLNPETVLIANIDDFSKPQALRLKEAFRIAEAFSGKPGGKSWKDLRRFIGDCQRNEQPGNH